MKTALIVDWPSVDATSGSIMSEWEWQVTSELMKLADFKPDLIAFAHPAYVQTWGTLFVGGKVGGELLPFAKSCRDKLVEKLQGWVVVNAVTTTDPGSECRELGIGVVAAPAKAAGSWRIARRRPRKIVGPRAVAALATAESSSEIPQEIGVDRLAEPVEEHDRERGVVGACVALGQSPHDLCRSHHALALDGLPAGEQRHARQRRLAEFMAPCIPRTVAGLRLEEVFHATCDRAANWLVVGSRATALYRDRK
jgi:hypothetical protein